MSYMIVNVTEMHAVNSYYIEGQYDEIDELLDACEGTQIGDETPPDVSEKAYRLFHLLSAMERDGKAIAYNGTKFVTPDRVRFATVVYEF